MMSYIDKDFLPSAIQSSEALPGFGSSAFFLVDLQRLSNFVNMTLDAAIDGWIVT